MSTDSVDFEDLGAQIMLVVPKKGTFSAWDIKRALEKKRSPMDENTIKATLYVLAITGQITQMTEAKDTFSAE